MFYPNLLNFKNSNMYKINFDSFAKNINSDLDDSVLPISTAKISYNFDCSGGSLKDGIGISFPEFPYSRINSDLRKELDFPIGLSIYGVWIFNAWHDIGNVLFPLLVIYCSDGKMYYNYLHSEQTQMIEMRNLHFTEVPSVITYNLNGVDTLILVNEVDGMYTWTEVDGGIIVDKPPKIKSMCLHYERIFATVHDNTRRVWFSDDLNPTNFNISSEEGGYIDLIDDFGRSNKVISFNNYLYVVRDYNIARITAFAEQDNFVVNQLDVGNSKIFADTVCLCDNKLIYLASDGLRTFNGSTSQKLNLGINKFFEGIDNKYAKSAFSDGYYYLSCRMNFDNDIVGCEGYDDFQNNALLKINVATGEFALMRGYDVRNICVINDTLGSTILCILYDGVSCKMGMLDNSGLVFNEPTNKVWQSPMVDLGYPNRDKVISEIYLNTVSDCTFKISVDNKVKIFRVKGKDQVVTIRPYLKGKKFSLRIETNDTNVKIEPLQLKVGLL